MESEVQYTVTSRGRPIGVTDLGFPYVEGLGRMGWFHPNPDGERLMPVVASVSAASRAYAFTIGRRKVQDTSPEGQQRESMLLADVAEAYQHVGALELRLHREDGSVVPTECVSIQDTEELIAWANMDDAVRDGEAWKYGEALPDPLYDPLEDVLDEELDEAFGGDADEGFEFEADDEPIFGDGLADCVEPWTPDDETSVWLPRYQIYVRFAEVSPVS